MIFKMLFDSQEVKSRIGIHCGPSTEPRRSKLAGHASVNINYPFAYFSDGMAGRSTDSLQAWKPKSMK